MSLDKILAELRRKNKMQYFMYLLCNTFSFAVISSYALLIFSPTVLEVLPVGGDSRKQAFGIFAAVCIGCMIFSFYSSVLFFKKKQVELGIMMAIGGNKKKLYKVIAKENLLIELAAFFFGCILANPINRIIWGILHLFIHNEEMKLKMDIKVIGIPLAMAAVMITVSFITLRKIIFSTELLDVINAEHKNEMKKNINRHTGLIGVILTGLGGIAAYAAPNIYMDTFSEYPPAWLNILFVIPLVGIYMILLHAVVNGFGAQKDKYKNMISRSMMIFQGKQTVNCLLVLTLLIGGGCFAGFYTPIMMSAFSISVGSKQWNYQYEMPAGIEGFQPQKLENIVTSMGGIINDRASIPMLLVAKDGMREIEENRKFYFEYKEILSTANIISKSSYESFSREKLDLGMNEYVGITNQEGLSGYDMDLDISIFTNMTTREKVHVVCKGTIPDEDLCLSNYSIYVVSDAVFEALSNGLGNEWKSTLYYMKVENDTAQIAESVYQAFVELFPLEYRIDSGYDRITKISYNEEGQDYWFDAPEYEEYLYYKDNNAEFEREWLYMPLFLSMSVQRSIRNYSVFMMLFVYVTLVAIVAFWMIAYTRSMTIGINNRYVFHDLEKLGASKSFRDKELKKQLAIIFKYPSLIGMIVVYLLYVLILFGNDGGMFTKGEIMGLEICLILEVVIGFLTVCVYKITVEKVKHILE